MIILLSHFPILHYKELETNELDIKHGRTSLFGIIWSSFFSRFMQGSSPELVRFSHAEHIILSQYNYGSLNVYYCMYSYSSYHFLNKVSQASNIKTFSISR